MAEMQKLINIILGSSKFARRRDNAAQVYRDEPILKTAAQLASYTPPRYREMRKIAHAFYYESQTRVFYEQAKFMADFEDDFTYQGEFTGYYPTYQAMSDQQLRGYFSWRTRVRRGIIEKTRLSFVFVYIYELLNQIGVSDALQGYYALKNFWSVYRAIDAKIDNYVRLWLHDYVVYHNLDKDLLQEFSDLNLDNAALVLLNYQRHDADEIFAALNSFSAYGLQNSRFFKEYPEDVKKFVCKIFSRLADYYWRKHKKSVCEKLVGGIYANAYTMFKSAVFYQQPGRRDLVYAVNDIYKYYCQGGQWSCERFFRHKGGIQRVGDLLKTIDFFMRCQYGFKSTLKAGKVVISVQNMICRELENFRAGLSRNAPIEIDVAQLDNIRSAALQTQNKLIVEQAGEPPEPGQTSGQSPANSVGLDNTQHCFFIRCLLYDRDYHALLKESGLMLSLVVDAINDTLFERFGDTVIIYDGERPALVEDYIDEMKRMI